MQTSYFTQKVNSEQRITVLCQYEANNTIDKQRSLKRDWIYNIENAYLEIGMFFCFFLLFR